MSDNNNTIIDYCTGSGMISGNCMMSIRLTSNKVKIFVPVKNLSPGISDADVELWSKIGNEMIFPAVMTKERIDLGRTLKTINALDQFVGLNVTCKIKSIYKQQDATNVVVGKLKKLLLNGSQFDETLRTSIFILKDRDNRNRNIDGWGGYAIDHQLLETGECLYEYVNRKLEEDFVKEDEHEGFNTYVFQIDCSKTISSNHKLAILSFYRFLWSNLYRGIVNNTLSLVSKGIEPWDALYYAMSTKVYEKYYAFLQKPGYKSLEHVVRDLKGGSSINSSFSAYTSSPFTSMNAKDLVSAVKAFKSNAPVDTVIKVLCVTSKLKSVSNGVTYEVKETTSFKDKYLVSKTNDYIPRYLLKRNFVRL